MCVTQCVLQASLNREWEALFKQIVKIDIKIQTFKQHGNHTHVANLNAVKVELQKKVGDAQTNLELKKTQDKRRPRTRDVKLVCGVRVRR